MALSVPATDPLHKVTIIPRGRALGLTMQLPERDKLSMTYEQGSLASPSSTAAASPRS